MANENISSPRKLKSRKARDEKSIICNNRYIPQKTGCFLYSSSSETDQTYQKDKNVYFI